MTCAQDCILCSDEEDPGAGTQHGRASSHSLAMLLGHCASYMLVIAPPPVGTACHVMLLSEPPPLGTAYLSALIFLTSGSAGSTGGT